MAELLLIDPNIITVNTILSGNTDFDKYRYCVLDAQLQVIEPLLGTLLYEKIKADYLASNLTGLYLELYNDFVVPILKYESVASYIGVASYMVDNAGIYKKQLDTSSLVEGREVDKLEAKHRSIAQTYVVKFNKWICKNPLPEYVSGQDDVNPDRDMNIGGFSWKL